MSGFERYLKSDFLQYLNIFIFYAVKSILHLIYTATSVNFIPIVFILNVVIRTKKSNLSEIG